MSSEVCLKVCLKVCLEVCLGNVLEVDVLECLKACLLEV
jgi:hypothetical protein